jgi:hypothetical protein
MVGAKEFAIGRKVIEKKTKNPIIEGISMPRFMRSHESEIKEVAGSFLDKQHKNSFSLPKIMEHEEVMVRRLPKMHRPHDVRTINPILEESEDRKPIVRNVPNVSKNKPEKSDTEDDFSEHLINHLTYKVFQNIKNYLDKDVRKPMGNPQIKLEINL